MAVARAWYINNDMVVSLSNLQSSTMASGTYLNSSLNVKCAIWKAATTGTLSDRLVNQAAMGYVAGSAGQYRFVAQSTAFSALTNGKQGLAIITVSETGLDGEWRVPFNVEYRGMD